jgi:hypothetical protein
MKRFAHPLVILVTLGFAAGCRQDRPQDQPEDQPQTVGQTADSVEAQDRSREREAIDALKQLGANVAPDERGRARVLRLTGPSITDADLKHVAALTELRALYLDGTKVTDAGMVHLEALTKLETLYCVSVAGARELRTVEALKEPTHLECIEAPLYDVVAIEGDYHNVRLKIDEEALTRANIPPDTPITAKHVNVPLREALDSILEPLDLVWKLDNGTLAVTTRKAVAEQRPNLTKLRQALPTLNDVLVDW